VNGYDHQSSDAGGTLLPGTKNISVMMPTAIGSALFRETRWPCLRAPPISGAAGTAISPSASYARTSGMHPVCRSHDPVYTCGS